MPSEPVENYLKSIFEIHEAKGKVTTSSLSEKLSVSPPSVSEMIQRLAEEGVLLHTPYREVDLTDKGRKMALKIIRRHRLWELFLVQVLNYKWDEIHDEAERLEHSTSDLLEQRLDEALGYPTRDPHGHVIPSREGEIDPAPSQRLSACPPGATVVVSHVSDENPQILQYMSKLGITIEKPITIREQMEFDGSMLVEIDGKEHFVSSRLAQQVFVRSGAMIGEVDS
jgi:DtxR family Mn-dependent transcriptional regulator